MVCQFSVALIASCTGVRLPETGQTDIISVNADTDALTKADGMTADELKSKSFFLLVDRTGDLADYYVKMVWDGSGWVTDDGTVMESTDEDMEGAVVTALFYDSDSGLSLEEFNAVTEYSVPQGTFSPDILYATNAESDSPALNAGTVEVSGTSVTVNFAHVMSRMVFEYDGDMTLSKICFKGIADSFSWNAACNIEYMAGNEAASVDVPIGDGIIECWLVPQETDGLVVEVTFADPSDGKGYLRTLSYSDVSIESGVTYTMNLTNDLL